VLRILALAQQTIRGVDLNGDEQIAPVRGEGGVLTAYQHAQLMAGIPFTRPRSAAAAAAPTAVAKVQPTLAPTPAPTAVSQAPAQPTEIQIADDEFLPKTFSVQVGATVVWTRTGTRPHTVTADDGSFDSGCSAARTDSSVRSTRLACTRITARCMVDPERLG
jgi:plastocyanin